MPEHNPNCPPKCTNQISLSLMEKKYVDNKLNKEKQSTSLCELP